MTIYLQQLVRISKSIIFEPHKAAMRIRYRLSIGSGAILPALYQRIWAQITPNQLIGSPTAADAVLTAEQKNLAFAKGLQLALYDASLQAKEALYLLPNGKSALVKSLALGIVRGDMTAIEACCFLNMLHQDPVREIIRTWFFSATWQKAYPDGVTILGRQAFAAWLGTQYKLPRAWLQTEDWPVQLTDAEQIKLSYYAHSDWQKLFPKALSQREQALALLQHIITDERVALNARQWCAQLNHEVVCYELISLGVNILGHFSYPSGLRSSTEALVAGLNEVGITTSLRNVRVDVHRDEPVQYRFNGLELFDISIIHIQPEPFFSSAYSRAGLYERVPKTYRIGYWYWEFGKVPHNWTGNSPYIDEIWVANEFIAKDLRQKFKQPVHVLMPSLVLPPFDKKPRAYFNLPVNKFIFSFVFHMSSVMERKNPLGLITAFKKVFSVNDNALLVIKVTFGEQHPAELKQLRDAAKGHSIVVIDGVLTRDEILSLIDCSDAYVSLHRGEGLGLTMAEAMLLGKPVVATRYSGNLEFMNDANSLLVDYDLITTHKDYPNYKKGLSWAEPSIEHAAQLMRQLYDNPEQGRALGQRAQQYLCETFNHQSAGQRIKSRIQAIQEARNIHF